MYPFTLERINFTHMKIVDLSLEILEVGIELHLPLIQVVVGFLLHLRHDHLELIEHHLHPYNEIGAILYVFHTHQFDRQLLLQVY